MNARSVEDRDPHFKCWLTDIYKAVTKKRPKMLASIVPAPRGKAILKLGLHVVKHGQKPTDISSSQHITL